MQVKSIAEMGAYVALLEYNGIEGMILLSELSRRRIRSITKLIKVRTSALCTSVQQQCLSQNSLCSCSLVSDKAARLHVSSPTWLHCGWRPHLAASPSTELSYSSCCWATESSVRLHWPGSTANQGSSRVCTTAAELHRQSRAITLAVSHAEDKRPAPTQADVLKIGSLSGKCLERCGSPQLHARGRWAGKTRCWCYRRANIFSIS